MRIAGIGQSDGHLRGEADQTEQKGDEPQDFAGEDGERDAQDRPVLPDRVGTKGEPSIMDPESLRIGSFA